MHEEHHMDREAKAIQPHHQLSPTQRPHHHKETHRVSCC